ncbi:MAG TPA: trehalose-phosphatase [Burkholderiales bacterium]|nr:trehalose-phosphatase [Burkholderiales bacterium]
MLLLDFDGTLAPFDADPGRVRPYPGVARLLDDIIAVPGNRVVIVSGRRLDDLTPALAMERPPELWGSHGWQRLSPTGEITDFVPHPQTSLRLDEAETSARALEAWGARIERKPASVAVHWRGLAPKVAEAVREALIERWLGASQSEDLQLTDFEAGLELRARGRNKGSVVNEVLAQSGPGTVAAYLGDDTTDEDAFDAIDGRGVGILVRPLVRRTRAGAWLRPPTEVRAFLSKWRACSGGLRA